MRSPAVRGALATAFADHERFLWGLCYRMTGSAADADDLVQETFAHALARPPADTEAPWRPWLVRVAMNLGRDLLRRRRRRAYVGPWLPSPIETGDDASPPAVEPTTTEGRYDLIESVSFAFLLALEALTPRQRAVLLLRDVFDYSVQETADALEMSASGVKTTHHRARRALRDYDRERSAPTRAVQERTREALARFLSGVTSRDRVAVEALLSEDVRVLSDGAGEHHAARKPVVGRSKVALFCVRIGERGGSAAAFDTRLVNGLPALVVNLGDARLVLQCALDRDGRIAHIHAVLASRKLSAMRFPAPAA
jgi:RNA polymerase sigma-70 factor (ECF subfamily)